MRQTLSVLALVVGLSTAASASVVTACQNFDLTQSCSYSGVTLGGFNIANVSSNNSLGAALTLPNLLYTVTYDTVASDLSITFSPARGLTLSQTGSQQTSFNLQFGATTSPLASIFLGVSSSQNSAATGLGSDQIVKQICSASFSSAICGATLYATRITTDAAPTSSNLALPSLSSFFVQDNVQIAANGSVAPGSAQVNSWTNTFHTSALSTPTPTPEPGSLAMLGAGLLAFAGLVRRRR